MAENFKKSLNLKNRAMEWEIENDKRAVDNTLWKFPILRTVFLDSFLAILLFKLFNQNFIVMTLLENRNNQPKEDRKKKMKSPRKQFITHLIYVL